MSNKFCCVTWESLAVELQGQKTEELDLLIADKGLPRSVFAPVMKVLGAMTNFCPVCGSALTQEAQDSLKIIATPIVQRTPEPQTQRRTCPKCNGKRNFGKDSNGVVINCMNCHGLGFVDQRHRVQDAKSEEEQKAEARIEEFEAGKQ